MIQHSTDLEVSVFDLGVLTLRHSNDVSYGDNFLNINGNWAGNRLFRAFILQ